jgi:hypothetical protein
LPDWTGFSPSNGPTDDPEAERCQHVRAEISRSIEILGDDADVIEHVPSLSCERKRDS